MLRNVPMAALDFLQSSFWSVTIQIMPILHIIEGPVGAGKTTYANQLGRDLGTPPLVLDAWMTNLF